MQTGAVPITEPFSGTPRYAMADIVWSYLTTCTFLDLPFAFCVLSGTKCWHILACSDIGMKPRPTRTRSIFLPSHLHEIVVSSVYSVGPRSEQAYRYDVYLHTRRGARRKSLWRSEADTSVEIGDCLQQSNTVSAKRFRSLCVLFRHPLRFRRFSPIDKDTVDVPVIMRGGSVVPARFTRKKLPRLLFSNSVTLTSERGCIPPTVYD